METVNGKEDTVITMMSGKMLLLASNQNLDSVKKMMVYSSWTTKMISSVSSKMFKFAITKKNISMKESLLNQDWVTITITFKLMFLLMDITISNYVK